MSNDTTPFNVNHCMTASGKLERDADRLQLAELGPVSLRPVLATDTTA
jgi:hypothetical protein